MEETMTHYKKRDIYYLDDFNVLKNEKNIDLNNKLFCTFTDQEGLDSLLEQIQRSYSIMYNKIFVLYVKSNERSFAIIHNIPSQMYNVIRIITDFVQKLRVNFLRGHCVCI